jgi:hypothetical protein
MHLLAPAGEMVLTTGFAFVTPKNQKAKSIFHVSALYDLNCVDVP